MSEDKFCLMLYDELEEAIKTCCSFLLNKFVKAHSKSSKYVAKDEIGTIVGIGHLLCFLVTTAKHPGGFRLHVEERG